MTDGQINITLNGDPRIVAGGSIAGLCAEIGLDPAKVAVERNLVIVPRSTLADVMLADGDALEIVHFVGGGQGDVGGGDDSWSVAGRTFQSRLIVGTGKYKDFEQNAAALVASGAQIITVAVRRVNVSDPSAPMLTDYIDPKNIPICPILRAVLMPTMPSGHCDWRARPAAGIWSNWKYWARPRRCIPICAKR
jgi:thiazole synthase